MKLLLAGIFLTSSIVSTATLARPPEPRAAQPRSASARPAATPAPNSAAQGIAILQAGLNAVIQGAAKMTGRPVDPDQGDDHASIIAVQRVCSKSTPAAQRSAICETATPD